jgi:5-methylcytosine-specific restriction endonuclease McrA
MPYRTAEERKQYAKRWREQNPDYYKQWSERVKLGERTVKPQARVPYSAKGKNKWIERYPEKYRKQMEAQRERRLENKRKLVEMFGGKCELCGYDKYLGALDFDHIDPSTKSFSIGGLLHASLEKCVEEAKKCRLLCANCHREHGARPKLDKYNALQ